jgi:recombinational DNA repair protein (RecF pathway)
MAAVILSPTRRYDTSCAFCGSTDPIQRLHGKAACRACIETAREAGVAFKEAPVAPYKPMEPRWDPVVPPERLRALIRYLLGMGPRDFPEPGWRRALRARGSLKE